MQKSKVYFTDFHTQAFGDGLPTKLKKLIKLAGIQLVGKREGAKAMPRHSH